MSATVDDRVLVAHRSARGFVPLLVVFVLVTAVYVVLGVVGVYSAWLTVFGACVFGAMAVLTGYLTLTAGRSGPQLVVDDRGVTVAGQGLLPWDRVRGVRVTGMRPRSVFWFSLGFRVVTVVDDGSAVVTGRAAWRRRTYGGTHLVMPYSLDVDADEIVAAVRRRLTP